MSSPQKFPEQQEPAINLGTLQLELVKSRLKVSGEGLARSEAQLRL